MQAKAIGCIALVISGCATAPSGPEIKAMFESADAVCKAGYADPRLESIRNKTPGLAGIQRPTLEMLADESRPTEQQRAAILIYDRAALNCATEYAKVYATGGADYLAAHSKTVSLTQAARAELYNGNLTFGEHARRMDAISQDARAAIAAIGQQREQKAIQRMGAAAAVMSAMPSYQLQPITLQPIQVPQIINCTSQRIGTYTYTNCR